MVPPFAVRHALHRAAQEWEQVRERHIAFQPWRLALTPFAPMPPYKSIRLRAASLSCVGTVDAPVVGHVQ